MDYANFSFHMDSEIVFGRDTENEASRLVKKYGGTKVMIVYGSGSIKRSGLLERVTNSLTESNIMFTELGGVEPNPKCSLVRDGISLAIDEKVDFVLGIGGGSSIDTAKAIALGAANEGDFLQFFRGKKPEKTLPFGTIVTIAASGSETSRSCVLVDDIETGLKISLWSYRARFAIMNPELTYTVSAYQTAAGAVDILSHTYMRYFSNYPSYFGDRIGEAAMKTVVKYAPLALEDPMSYEARAELLLAGSLSHCDLMFIGRPEGNSGGEHSLESQLSGHYNTTHGAGLAVLMPALLKYFSHNGTEQQLEKLARFATSVFDVSPDPAATSSYIAARGIVRFYDWLRSLDMPTTLTELGIPKNEIDDMVARCLVARGPVVSGFINLDKKAVTEIYEIAAKERH